MTRKNVIYGRIMFNNIEACIFDLDGTLVDSMTMWKQIDIDYLARFGIELPDDLQQSISGLSFHETAIYFQNRFGITDDTDTIESTWNSMAEDYYRYKVPVKDGVPEFLVKLKEKGYKTGIATSNSIELLEVVLEALNIRQYFDEIHTANEVAKGKPAPDIYLLVAEKLETAPEKCMVFEDLCVGLTGGIAAGMRTCAVEDRFSEGEREEKKRLSDYYINDYTEIINKL